MNIYQTAIALVSAIGVAAIATPFVSRLARRLGAVDRPNPRKVNRRENIPLLGGLAVAMGCLAAIVAAVLLHPEILQQRGNLLGFLIGGTLVLSVGLYDDCFGLTARPKLIVQILAAIVAIYFGFEIPHITEPFTWTTLILPAWISWPVTILWIVGITNAVNLIDGLDGLAAGLGAIIAATLALISWQAGDLPGVILGVALTGALLGFLPFNFYPGRIFLGDTGSLFIGYSLSLLALEGYRTTSLLPFVVPLMALAVPLLDTALSILRRLRAGRPVFDADRMHMHHRFLETEGSDRAAVLALYFLTGCFCIIAISFTRLEGYTAIIFFGAVILLTIRLLRNLGAFSAGVDGLESVDVPPAGAKGERH